MSTPHEYYYKSIKKCEEKDNRYFGCSHENIYTRKITMLVIKAKIDVAYEWSHDTCKSADNFHSLFVPNTTPPQFSLSFPFYLFPIYSFIILLQLQTNKEKIQSQNCSNSDESTTIHSLYHHIIIHGGTFSFSKSNSLFLQPYT
jgi:hypothetical protein